MMGTILVFIISAVILYRKGVDHELNYNHSSLEETENINWGEIAHLTFYWDAWAIFDDDDVFRMIQREDYEGETWEECCDECVRYRDWDDSYLVKGYESNVIETNRELKEISTDENGDEVAAPQEVYDYYQNAMEKLKEKEKREQEERETKRK